MEELIKVDFSADRLTVSARDLHEFLGVKTAYKDWFPRMCEYGFTEGADFNPLKIERVQQEGSRTVTREVPDAALTIDMAKEICMVTRNEKGKQARQYFIQLEKDWNSPEKVMARALRIADVQISTLKADNARLTAQIEADAPSVHFAKTICVSKDAISVGTFAKILTQSDVKKTGRDRLFAEFRERGYLMKSGADKNMPIQRYVDEGLFQVKESTGQDADGSPHIYRQTLITGKGQQYFINLFLKEKAEAAITVTAQLSIPETVQ